MSVIDWLTSGGDVESARDVIAQMEWEAV
ncbi:hypothetical protein Rwratislav_11448 [Rhodococcus wratislaviensis IFP 2016]|nr:hypothetical protein Rwratislav_11448 [Rhodococcus wratislaviensis IFP 2016]